MTKKIYLITDLGPGDGGKGGVVHRTSTMMRAHTIIKVGGGQGSHGVRTARGEVFNFSHWGCGTFEGIRTHLSSRMVIMPEGVLNEESILRHRWGIEAFDLLTIDQNALCATPFHRIASRVKELSLGESPRGTIGTGVGEAYRYLSRHPDFAIRAGNLADSNLRDRLAAVREQVRADLNEILHKPFLPGDAEILEEERDRLCDDDFLEYVVKRFQEVSRRANIVDSAHLGEKILSQDGVAVIESSHGVLTDHYLGFHPHTSAIRTLPRFTHQMLEEAGYNGQIVNLGVTRAYAIRHGAGPLPTHDDALSESLLPGSSKGENRYQGKVRTGPLDLVLLRYAIEACGGLSAFDGLAITWFDQIQANKEWHVCKRYRNSANSDFFTPSGEIVVREGETQEQLERQAALTQSLFRCEPEVETIDISSAADLDTLYSICAETITNETKIPVRMVSFGPTEGDKLCK